MIPKIQHLNTVAFMRVLMRQNQVRYKGDEDFYTKREKHQMGYTNRVAPRSSVIPCTWSVFSKIEMLECIVCMNV